MDANTLHRDLRQAGRTANHRFLPVLALLLGAGISGCWNDNDNPAVVEPDPLPTTSMLQLEIISTLGEPLSEVQVQAIGTGNLAQHASDADGHVSLGPLPADTRTGIVLTHPDYAAGMTVLATAAGGETRTHTVMLARRALPIVASAEHAATLRGADGVSVTYPANAFVTAAGTLATGPIVINLTPLDITAEAGVAAFPGEFLGIPDGGGDPAMIISQGVAEFRFTQDGETLQLAAGVTATIEIPLYAAMHADGRLIEAGDSIELWNLDTSASNASGAWQQHGTGTVVVSDASPTGLVLRADVGHFSWWNADEFARRGNLSVRVNVFDERGNIVGDTSKQARLLGTATGYRAADVNVPINQRVENLIVPAGVTLCTHAEMVINNSDGHPVRAESNTLCTIIPENQSRHLELNLQIPLFSLAQDGPTTATEGTPIAACGTPARIKAAGGVPPLNIERASGALPAGLTYSSSSGYIWGTPTGVGPFDPNPSDALFNATDYLQRSASTRVAIRVYEPMRLNEIVVMPVLKATVPQSLGGFIQPTGGMPPYRYRLAADGALPPGMRIDLGNGTLFGTPEVISSLGEALTLYFADVQVLVEDANCARAILGFRLPVIYTPRLSGTPASPVAQSPFSFTPANSGAPIEQWAVEPGLTDWLSFDPDTGTLSGTPQDSHAGDTVSVTIVARNNLQHGPEFIGESRLAVDLVVLPRLPVITLPSTSITLATGQSLDLTPGNTGGEADRWTITNAPGWLSFNTATGRMTGTPLAADVHSDIELSAINAAGTATLTGLSITVVPAAIPPALSGTAPAGVIGTAYGFAVTNSGGLATSWSSSGSLPAGVIFSAGVFSGTPTVAGTFSGITVTASNSAGSGSLPVTIDIAKRVPSISFASPGPITVVEDSPSFTNAATTNSSGTVSYSSSAPSVASVGTGGSVSILGVGTTLITATVTEDTQFQAGSASYTLEVISKAIAFSVTSPPEALAGVTFSFTPTVTEGRVDQWSLTGAPDWIDIHPVTGYVEGTPPADFRGTVNFAIVATNSGGGSASQAVSIGILPGAPLLSGTPPDKVGFGNTYSFRPDNLGGEATSWSIVNKPRWAEFDAAYGELYGTPQENDQALYESIVIVASNSAGSSQLGPFSIQVTMQPPRPSYGFDFTQFAYPGAAYRMSPLNVGGAAEYWEITVDGSSDGLPAWLSFNSATGALRGQPQLEAVGQHLRKVVISAVNPGGTISLEPFQILVKLEPPFMKAEGGAGQIYTHWSPDPKDSPHKPLRYDVEVRDRDGNLVIPRIEDAQYNLGVYWVDYGDYSEQYGRGILALDGFEVGQPYAVTLFLIYDDLGVIRELPSRTEIVVPSPLRDTGYARCSYRDASDGAANRCPDPDIPAQDGEMGKSLTYDSFLERISVISDGEPTSCVLDPATGLAWKNQSYKSSGAAALLTHAEAIALAASRNAQAECGRTDWRLPTVHELTGVMDMNYLGSEIASLVQSLNEDHLYYWTANSYAPAASQAWLVWFSRWGSGDQGWITHVDRNESHSVMLVSGTSIPPILRDNGDGTVTELSTALTWQKCLQGQVYDPSGGTCEGEPLLLSWREAMQRAAAVRAGETSDGLSDWRVPNPKELLQLVDYTVSEGPAISQAHFPGMTDTNAYRQWTSTPSVRYATWVASSQLQGGYFIDFETAGLNGRNDASYETYALRLVRGGVSPRQWYVDADGDGFGAPAEPIIAVIPPGPGYVGAPRKSDLEVSRMRFDCDDSDREVNPLRSENPTDGKDNDCNGLIDETDPW